MRIVFAAAAAAFFSLNGVHFSIAAESHVAEVLAHYAQFMEKGLYGERDWSHFDVRPKSRYHTFKLTFEHFEKSGGKIIVELGTSRSFVDGCQPGCMSGAIKYWQPDNPEVWDWGAGFFTRVVAECLQHLMPEIHTFDISVEHIRRSKIITEEFAEMMHYHVCSSLTFLKECDFPGGIDLLYLDTGGIDEATAHLHLAEAKIIVERDLIAPGGYILIDDVRNQNFRKKGNNSGYGKARYSLPYLLENGFEIVAYEYQVILRKSA